MTDKKLHELLSEVGVDRSSPFFEEGVMAGIDRPSRATRLRKPIAVVSIAVLVSLSFILPRQLPLRVDAHAELATTITQADIFNFGLSGKLPIDKATGQYVELTSDGELLTSVMDSFGLRYHPVNSFYRALNVDVSAMHHFDSLLESYALQLRTASLTSYPGFSVHSDLLALSRDLSREMMAIAGNSTAFNDTLSLFFRLGMQERLARAEDSLIAAADTLPTAVEPAMIAPGGLTEKPRALDLQPVHLLGDSLPGLARG